MKKVLVGMSGGIDSSVVAYLLKQQGYEVEGITMLIWRKDSPYPAPASPNSCYKPDKSGDLEKIDAICRRIGIRHRVVDCSALYESKVLDNFKSEYMNARTPNPCIWCNALIKFGAMIDEARKSVDFDYFATGHYARTCVIGGRHALLKARDPKKDQSYFLSRLSQEQLSWTLFPLGDLLKSDVRRMDEELGLHEPGEKESQDFYGGSYSDLLQVEPKKGDIVFKDGTRLGVHDGFWNYTIGQRKGLGVAYSEPLYVISLDPDTNTVVVGLKEDTVSKSVRCSNVNFVSYDGFHESSYSVKIRSASPGLEASVEECSGGMRVVFPHGAGALTPGQSAVVYSGDAVVASAIMEKPDD